MQYPEGRASDASSPHPGSASRAGGVHSRTRSRQGHRVLLQTGEPVDAAHSAVAAIPASWGCCYPLPPYARRRGLEPPPASWLWDVSGRAVSSSTGEPAIESTTRRQRAAVGRKSASQRSGMSETCSSPTPASWRVHELGAATRQGEPSAQLLRTADNCVATASVTRASKLAKAASAQDRPRLPASWGPSSASWTACPSSEGLRNTHPAIRYSTLRPYAVEQVVSCERLGFPLRRQAAAESPRE